MDGFLNFFKPPHSMVCVHIIVHNFAQMFSPAQRWFGRKCAAQIRALPLENTK